MGGGPAGEKKRGDQAGSAGGKKKARKRARPAGKGAGAESKRESAEQSDSETAWAELVRVKQDERRRRKVSGGARAGAQDSKKRVDVCRHTAAARKSQRVERVSRRVIANGLHTLRSRGRGAARSSLTRRARAQEASGSSNPIDAIFSSAKRPKKGGAVRGRCSRGPWTRWWGSTDLAGSSADSARLPFAAHTHTHLRLVPSSMGLLRRQRAAASGAPGARATAPFSRWPSRRFPLTPAAPRGHAARLQTWQMACAPRTRSAHGAEARKVRHPGGGGRGPYPDSAPAPSPTHGRRLPDLHGG